MILGLFEIQDKLSHVFFEMNFAEEFGFRKGSPKEKSNGIIGSVARILQFPSQFVHYRFPHSNTKCVSRALALIHYITVQQGAGSRSDSRQYVALLWCQVDSLCATCGSRCCVVVLLRSPPPMCCGLCESLVTVCCDVLRSASNHNHLGSGGWVTWVLGTPETPLWPSLPCMGSQGDSIDSHYHRAWEEPEATGWWRHPDFEKCFDDFVDKMQSRVLHFLLLRPL